MAKYSDEEKKIIVAAYEAGVAVSDLCVEHSVSSSSVYSWVQQFKMYERYSKDKITSREINMLEIEVKRLRKENEIFRRCSLNEAISMTDKLKLVEELRDEFGVRPVCRALDIRHSYFYHYLRRKKYKTIIETDDEMLRPQIKELFEKSKERFGSRKIRAKLIESGITISQRRIIRLMSEMGLVCKQSRLRYCSTTVRKHNYYRNKLKQEFKQPAPNLVWVSDITYVRVKDNFYYICIVIDLFSRRVISHTVSANIDMELVWITFDHAFKIKNYPNNLTFHSDQGQQFTAYKFRRYLRKLQVDQSFSNPGTPLDNAVAESFFACLKREELSHNTYDTQEQLVKDVDEFVNYYNSMRPHQKLGFKTPEQVEAEFYSAENE